jgi:hypothetical protein
MRAIDLASTPFPAGRHPWQVWSQAYALFVALGAFGQAEPQSLQAILWPEFLWLWAATLMLGTILSMVGPWWPRRITGVLLERVGQGMVAFACSAYAVAIIGNGAGSRISTLLPYVGATIAASVRWKMLSGALKVGPPNGRADDAQG